MSIDERYPRLALVALLGFVVLGLVVGTATSAAPFGPYNYDWDGGSELRTELGSTTTVDVAHSTDEYGDTSPQGTAAVVIDPGSGYGAGDRSQLSSFVLDGGTLVIADGDETANVLLSELGVSARIDGTPVQDEEYHHRVPALVRANEVEEHDRVRDVDALTLNHGTVLDPGEATPLVNTSVLAYLDENGNEELDENETLASRSVAAVEPLGAGEVVVVSDESAFTNAMLDQAGNRQFVRNLAADHDRVVLDYSADGSLPPLTYLFLTLREAPLLQFLLGASGVAIIALWGSQPLARLQSAVDRRRGSTDVTTAVTEETVATYLADRHPHWDGDRIRRVSKAITRQRRQGGHDD